MSTEPIKRSGTRFIRTIQEGESWIPLANNRLLITHPERQPIVFDVDSLTESDALTLAPKL